MNIWSIIDPPGYRFLLLGLAASFSLLLGLTDTAASAQPDFAQFQLTAVTDNQQLILINGNIHYTFSHAVLEALDNGLPIVLETTIKIEQPHPWFLDKLIWSNQYRHAIRYHAISQQYLVSQIAADFPQAYLTRTTALTALGEINKLPLLQLAKPDINSAYIMQINTQIASDALPVPLRHLTLLSDQWNLQSHWQRIDWPTSTP